MGYLEVERAAILFLSALDSVDKLELIDLGGLQVGEIQFYIHGSKYRVMVGNDSFIFLVDEVYPTKHNKDRVKQLTGLFKEFIEKRYEKE